MRKMILGSVMLSLASVGAMEIPGGNGNVLREAQPMVGVVNANVMDIIRFAQSIRRLQNVSRVESERTELALSLIMRNPINERSADLMNMDLRGRHVTVSALYMTRFCPLREMFARQDLGVRATMADLEAVRTYVENTKVVLESVMTRGSDYFDSAVLSGLLGQFWFCWLHDAIRDNYRAGKIVYESQQARLGIARNAVFPAVSFDALVDQVNSFYRDVSAQLMLPPVEMGNHGAVERSSLL